MPVFLKKEVEQLYHTIFRRHRDMMQQVNLKPIVITAIHTGMRKGEILKLKWDEVDLNHGFILLEKTKNGEQKEIPINTTLEEILLNLHEKRRSDYVFPNHDGKPYTDLKKRISDSIKKGKY